MKKILLVVVLVAIAGAGWWWWQSQARGEAPTVAATLSAEHTVGFASVQRVDALAKTLVTALEGAGADAKAGPLGMLTDSASRKAALGFDPAESAGWAEAGLDPTVGVNIVVDSRVLAGGQPLPIALFKVTDREKLLAYIEARAGAKPTLDASQAPVETVTFGGKTALMGTRQGYTALLLGPARKHEQARAGFAAFLGDTSGDLAKGGTLKRAFDGAEDLYFAGYLSGQGAVTLVKGMQGLPEVALSTATHIIERFPGLSYWLGGGAAGGRLVATDKGVELIQKLMVPARKPPEFSRFLGAKGWGAVRISVNLKDLFSGIGDALPPSMSEVKSQIGMAPMMLPMVLGFGWDDLTAAVSGHVVVAFDLASTVAVAQKGNASALQALVLVAVGDTAKADSLVPELLKLAGKAMPNVKPEAVTVAGHAGHKISVAGVEVAVVRVDDVLLGGTIAAIEAAVKRADGEHLTDKTAVAAIDGADVVEGVFYDGEAVAKALAEQGVPGLEAALKGKTLAMALRHDSHGLYGRTDTLGLSTMVGLVGGVGASAFKKYIEASRAAERRVVSPEMPFMPKAPGQAVPTAATVAPPSAAPALGAAGGE